LKILLDYDAIVDSQFVENVDNEYGYREHTAQTAFHMIIDGPSRYRKKSNGMIDFLSATLLIEYGCNINALKTYYDQVIVEKPEESKNIENPRDINYHSGLETHEVHATALHRAVINCNISAVLFLLSHRVDKNVAFCFSETNYSFKDFYNEKSNLTEDEIKLMNIALQGQWTPSFHQYFSDAFKVIVLNVLMCFSNATLIPKEVVFSIIGYLSTYPLSFDLLQKYYKPQINKTGKNGKTALMIATEENHKEIVDILSKTSNNDVEKKRDTDKNTALTAASKKRS